MGVCLSISIWMSMYYIGYFLDPASDIGKFWPKFIYVGVTFIIITLFHYEVRLLNFTQYYWLIKINYVLGFILCVFILATDLFLAGIYYYSWGTYPKAGPLLWIYQICYAIFVIRLIIFPSIQTLLNPQSSDQSKIYAKYFLAATVILSIAMVDFLPALGIGLYPIGYIPVTIFTLILAFAVILDRPKDL
jgi:hypothetical protein